MSAVAGGFRCHPQHGACLCLLWPVSMSGDGCLSLLLGGPSGVLGPPVQLHMPCLLNHSPHMVSDPKLWLTGEGVPLSPAKLNGSDSSKSLPSPSSSPQPDWIASPTHDPQWCPSDPTDSSLSSLFGKSEGAGCTELASGQPGSGSLCVGKEMSGEDLPASVFCRGAPVAGLGPAHFALVENGQGVHPARHGAGWTLASRVSTREGMTPGSPEHMGLWFGWHWGASPLHEFPAQKVTGSSSGPHQRGRET